MPEESQIDVKFLLSTKILKKNRDNGGDDVFYKKNNDRHCLHKRTINSFFGAKCAKASSGECWGLSANTRNSMVRTDEFIFMSL